MSSRHDGQRFTTEPNRKRNSVCRTQNSARRFREYFNPAGPKSDADLSENGTEIYSVCKTSLVTAVVSEGSAVTRRYIHLKDSGSTGDLLHGRVGMIGCVCKFECSSTMLTCLLQASTSVHASLGSLASWEQLSTAIAGTAICDLCPNVWFGHLATP